MLRKVQKLVAFLKEESKFTRGIYRGLVLLHSCTTPGPFSVLWKRRSPENWHRYYPDSLDSGALQRLANGRQRLKEGGWEGREMLAPSCSAPHTHPHPGSGSGSVPPWLWLLSGSSSSTAWALNGSQKYCCFPPLFSPWKQFLIVACPWLLQHSFLVSLILPRAL